MVPFILFNGFKILLFLVNFTPVFIVNVENNSLKIIK